MFIKCCVSTVMVKFKRNTLVGSSKSINVVPLFWCQSNMYVLIMCTPL